MAKRNYEALNQQLIEELPRFIQLVQSIIDHTVTVLFQLQFRFHTAVHAALHQLAEQYTPRNRSLPLSSSETIQAAHSEALSEVGGQLISLSIVPASLTMSLPTAIRSGHQRVSESSGPPGEGDREDSILSTSSEVDMDSSISEVWSLLLSLDTRRVFFPTKTMPFQLLMHIIPIRIIISCRHVKILPTVHFFTLLTV